MFYTKIKRISFVTLCVVLCVALLAGSAFALTPGFTTVSMPDPYGVSVLSLNDDTTVRSLYSNSALTYGSYSSAVGRGTYAAGTRTFYPTSSAIENLAVNTTSIPYSGAYLKIPSGFYFDMSATVSYSASDYDSLLISGGGSAYMIAGTASYVTVYPSTVQLLVNGSPVGDVYSYSGGWTFPTIEVEMTEDVYSLGFRFSFASGTKTNTSSSYSAYGYGLGFHVADNTVVSAVEGTDDYTMYLGLIVNWLQAIFQTTNPLLNAIETLSSAMSESSGGIGKLVSVFATDDDLSLKADTVPVASSAADAFYNPDSSTSIKSEDVDDVKNVIEGTDTLFNSGYEITDVFEEIGGNDDFMLWFSADTASSLDSTGATAADDDSDPFNHWRVDEQMDAINERLGGGDE